MCNGISLFLAISFCVSALASPSFHNYELFGFPKLSTDCAEAGKNIASRFEKVTTVIPTGFKGSQDGADTCRVKITYVAEKPFLPVTTAPIHTLSGKGSYESAAACESALTDRTSQFESETGRP